MNKIGRRGTVPVIGIAVIAAVMAAGIWVYRTNLRNADLPHVYNSAEYMVLDHDTQCPNASVNPMINTAVCATTMSEADRIMKEIEGGKRKGPGGKSAEELMEEVTKNDKMSSEEDRTKWLEWLDSQPPTNTNEEFLETIKRGCQIYPDYCEANGYQ